MRFGLEENIIDKIIKVFEANSKVDKAIMFGSRAKGNYRPDSDIDIAIKGYNITMDDILKMSVAFEDIGIKNKIDLIDYSSIKEKALVEHIDRVGIEFYSRWEENKLGELCIKIGSGATPTGGSNAYKLNGISLIRSQNVLDFKFNYDGLAFIDEEQAFSLKNVIVEENDILLNITGDSVARVCKVPKEVLPARVNQHVAIIRPNKEKLNYDYLLYQLQSSKENLLVFSEIGGTRNALTKAMIEDFKLLVPPLSEQTTIASILSSLDDKIDLLHRQNKTLELLSKTLFRQWFVEGRENNNSDTLGNYVESANTGLDAIKRAPIVEFETGVKCLRIQDISQDKTIEKWGNSKVEENNFERFQLKKDDIIMARTCTPGINLFIREDLQAVFNNGLVRIRAKKDKVYPILLYYLFKTREFIGHIDGISGGTSVQLNMQIGELLSYDFSFPSIDSQNKIIDSFLFFDDKIFNNQIQIRTLTKLRDTLLPKLMNGEVRVRLSEHD